MHTDYPSEAPRYKQLSEPIKVHQHEYDIVVSDTIVVRFCPDCGAAWKIERSDGAHKFTNEWEPIV